MDIKDTRNDPVMEKYLNDPTFHHLVDSITNAMIRGDLTPTNLIEALIEAMQLAYVMYVKYRLEEIVYQK